MRKWRRPAQELRFAVECLPRPTRIAMLEGIQTSNIIVGAYTDREGGVCPMLAAHRRGGRTDLASFARAWDRYTGATRYPRPATEREVGTLTAMLEASLLNEDPASTELAEAVSALRDTKARRSAPPPASPPAPADRPHRGRDTGECDRTGELRRRLGWAWLRPVRRFDEYEAALDRLREAEENHRRTVAGQGEADGAEATPDARRELERV